MRSFSLSIEEVCRRLKPFLGKKSDELYLKYSVAETREEKEQIHRALTVLYEKYLNTSLLDDPILLNPPADISADFLLGDVIYANKSFGSFGLRNKDWPRHVCVTGMSGSGKTTFAFTILHNFMKYKVPFMVFDWKKSFRPLMAEDDEMLCFTVGNSHISNLFRININRPPTGVPPKEWVGILCDLIVESFFASFGVHKVFREVLDQAFRDFGVYGGSNNYPTWRQIRDRLEDMAEDMGRGSRREGEWMESALRIADSLTFGSFGDAICSKDSFGMTVTDLMNYKVLFELHALGNAEKKFFCEFILSFLYYERKFGTVIAGQDFKHGIVVDEAHHIFLKDKPSFVKESVTEIVYRELREYGISLICLDQHISKISEVVVGNSATNIAFQQVLPEDVYTVAGLMQLREHQNYFSNLGVGQAIVKLADRYMMPFSIQAPFVDTKASIVTDEMIKDLMQKKMKGIKTHKKVLYAADERNITRAMEKAAKIYMKGGVTIDVSDNHRQFMDLLRKKAMNVSQAYDKLGLSSRKCDALKKDLVAQGLMSVEEVKSPKGLKKMLSLTDKGLGFIKDPKKTKKEDVPILKKRKKSEIPLKDKDTRWKHF